MADLIQLKEQYPNRVHLILGNRDINKLRMLFSTHSTVLAQLPAVYWLRGRSTRESAVDESYQLNCVDSKVHWVSRVEGVPKK
mmetsp:Transcript_26092/g.43460  ORF Transcript_26092/g.43460 Transcript_26092/m.43460 type:complete len:83 (+) Transcript_26092:101-349(+)